MSPPVVRQPSLNIGDRLPFLVGVGAGEAGRFYSLDQQAGRPAVLIRLATTSAEVALAQASRLARADDAVRDHGADLVLLAPQSSRLALGLNQDPEVRRLVIFAADVAALAAWDASDAALMVLIDRSGRIMEVCGVETEDEVVGLCRRFADRIKAPASTRRQATAPVLLIPNLVPEGLCRDLIAFFEASPHKPGAMAGLKDGAAAAKYDAAKKLRRDFELEPGTPLHQAVLEILATRCVPEIKRAFQSDITFADRILLARYDDTGGYFKRHRDDGAPHTAFREFAISINLNTHEYEGGELLFPEFDDDRYSPAAGAAAIFSASLLHEAAPVLRGRRYVLLSFLCSAAGQAKMTAAA